MMLTGRRKRAKATSWCATMSTMPTFLAADGGKMAKALPLTAA
jgi:hypothetical protein